MYTGRKRRKPVHKGVKTVPAEGAKSNPSKRHRDRLNSELDHLASLLPFPEDVISSLDKLSILRLSVSYLRTKSFFSVVLKNQPSSGKSRSSEHKDAEATGRVDGRLPEGELLLQALNGFVLVVTAEGIIFFCSHTIQDYLGFHQTDVMHQSVFELIHSEDQQEFRRNLHWALNPPSSLLTPTDPPTEGESASASFCHVSYSPDESPPENSSFLERSFVCRFRCLLENSSGFLALNIQGRLKFFHDRSRRQAASEAGALPQPAMFAIATPLQSAAILEIRTRNMIFRTKHKLDFTPMACDAKGKIVLGYTEAELRVRGTGYQFIHAADMLHCAENHVRMIKTGESGLTVFRLLTKDNRWTWVQANARLVYKNGKPDYITATQRPLVEEEGEEHLRKRSMHLPFTFATGEALLYQTGYPLHGFPDSFQDKSKGCKSKKGKLEKRSSDDPDPKSLLGALMSQDGSVYVSSPDREPAVSYHSSHFSQQQSGTGGFGGLLSGDSWHMVASGETGISSRQMTGDDTLLATLDLLCLDEDETCSNTELFSALENLGLNAEDLEHLLLEPNHIPTVTDLLTNNEILSYIHSSTQSGTEGEEQGHQDVRGPLDLPPTSGLAQSGPQQEGLTSVPPEPPRSRQQIIQLQHHTSAGEMMKALPGWTQLVSQPGTVDSSIFPGFPNGHRQHDHTTELKTSQSSSDHKGVRFLLDSSQQWQVHQAQHSVHPQAHQPFRSHNAFLPGFQNQFGMSHGSIVTKSPAAALFAPESHTELCREAATGSFSATTALQDGKHHYGQSCSRQERMPPQITSGARWKWPGSRPHPCLTSRWTSQPPGP